MGWEDIANKLNKEEEKKREQEERAARQRERAEEKQREAEERARQQQGRAPKEWTPKKSQETVTRYSAETIQDFDYRHDITYRDRSRYTRDQLEYGRDQAIGKMRGIGKWSEEQINKYRAAPHFRVAFIKAPEDKTFALFKMNKEELQKLEREPELVLIGPKDKQIGVPVKVSEYLEATRDRNMAEAIRNQHMPLPETVYNKEINPKTQELELTYKESLVKEDNKIRMLKPKEKEHEQERAVVTEKEQKRTVREAMPVNAKGEHTDWAELSAELAEANEMVTDRDLYGATQNGVNRDTTRVYDGNNIAAQTNSRINDAYAADKERREAGLENPHQDAVYDEVHDDPEPDVVSKDTTADKQQPQHEDSYTYRSEPAGSSRTETRSVEPTGQLSYRELIEQQDEEYYNEEMEHTFGS